MSDQTVVSFTPPAPTIPVRLRRLRERAGRTIVECAKAAGFGGPSGFHRYENEALFTKDVLPVPLVAKLVPLFVGQGNPAVTREEVWALAGVLPQGVSVEATPFGKDVISTHTHLVGWQCPLCRTVWAPHVDCCTEKHG